MLADSCLKVLHRFSLVSDPCWLIHVCKVLHRFSLVSDLCWLIHVWKVLHRFSLVSDSWWLIHVWKVLQRFSVVSDSCLKGSAKILIGFWFMLADCRILSAAAPGCDPWPLWALALQFCNSALRTLEQQLRSPWQVSAYLLGRSGSGGLLVNE